MTEFGAGEFAIPRGATDALLRLGRANPESIQGSLPRTDKRHEETNAGEIPSTGAASAGGLSYFSSGSVRSGFRATA